MVVPIYFSIYLDENIKVSAKKKKIVFILEVL